MQARAVHLQYLLLALLIGGCEANRNPDNPDVATLPSMSVARGAQACFTTARALDQNGYEADAIVEYERARELDPHIKGVSRRLAVLYDRQGNDARAVAEYKAALNESPYDAGVLNDYGFFYIIRNDGVSAEPWLRTAVTKDPTFERGWLNLATALAEQRKYSEAYGAFTRVLPPSKAWSNLGMIQSQQGDYNEAVESLRRAEEADPQALTTAGRHALKWVRQKQQEKDSPPDPRIPVPSDEP